MTIATLPRAAAPSDNDTPFLRSLVDLIAHIINEAGYTKAKTPKCAGHACDGHFMRTEATLLPTGEISVRVTSVYPDADDITTGFTLKRSALVHL